MGQGVSEGDGKSHYNARAEKKKLHYFVTLSLIMPAPSAAPSRPPRLSLPSHVTCTNHTACTCARVGHREQTEGQEIASTMELRQQLFVHPSCRSIDNQAAVIGLWGYA